MKNIINKPKNETLKEKRIKLKVIRLISELLVPARSPVPLPKTKSNLVCKNKTTSGLERLNLVNSLTSVSNFHRGSSTALFKMITRT